MHINSTAGSDFTVVVTVRSGCWRRKTAICTAG